MGLIMKKDDSEDNEYIDGIEVVGRGEGRTAMMRSSTWKFTRA